MYGSCDDAGHTIVQERGIVLSVYVRALIVITEGIVDPGTTPVVYDSRLHTLTQWEFRSIGRWLAGRDIVSVRTAKTLNDLVSALRAAMSPADAKRAAKRAAADLCSSRATCAPPALAVRLVWICNVRYASRSAYGDS